jgi:hypothetical protein
MSANKRQVIKVLSLLHLFSAKFSIQAYDGVESSGSFAPNNSSLFENAVTPDMHYGFFASTLRAKCQASSSLSPARWTYE